MDCHGDDNGNDLTNDLVDITWGVSRVGIITNSILPWSIAKWVCILKNLTEPMTFMIISRIIDTEKEHVNSTNIILVSSNYALVFNCSKFLFLFRKLSSPRKNNKLCRQETTIPYKRFQFTYFSIFSCHFEQKIIFQLSSPKF